MKKIKEINKKFLYKLPINILNRIYIVYDFLFYKKNRYSKRQLGNRNSDKTLYIIRPRDNTVEGLMSLLLNTVKHLNYVEEKHFLPVYDFKNYNTQYNNYNMGDNIWEYYFDQGPVSLEEAYSSQNVIFGGLALTRTEFLDFNNWTNDEQIERSRFLINKYVNINEKTKSFIEKEIAQINLEKTLGLYIRGTDYTRLKPTGHPIQPTIEQSFAKADEFVSKYKLSSVFLVTEDQNVYNKATEHFKDKLLIASFDKFINRYDGSDFLSNGTTLNDIADNAYERGLYYLTKIIILSRLNYFVAGNTCGSWAAMSFSKGYSDYCIFDLGNY